MRILVAGRTGQLALELADRLPQDGHAVTALEAPELDLTDPESIARTVRDAAPEAIVNAAAYTAVDRAEDQPELAHAINATGAGLLAAAAAARGIPFVHVSTDYVFDGCKGSPYVEADAPSPPGVYGASKLAGERAVMAAHPRSVVLRTAWVCSPHGNNFLKTMLRLGAERESLSVVADQHGAPSFAADLADAIARMLPRLQAEQAGSEAFGVFHLTGQPWTTWHGFAAEIFRQAGARGRPVPQLKAIATSEYPTRAQRPADGRLDCSRIGAVHGITPADWRESLARCLDSLIGR
ncbi:dTDP-4-dehydrorhamnose reductase [Roseomonas sp. E05]|uniref:dTDP-4-dehydrorhamnose reductase n=1 Tax=Roseomonas sp. E05 TaxID=3046310 RepID=UPI0024BB57FB|nr:dTDP-4-dehydrorhamnose reductase [Roseomonas sp. E05]MDJ0390155.1 dTDP-4-dehydrorhamnose reductase [Roseomonas sp. E05]